MAYRDSKEFYRWMKKSKVTEIDIINCRKMQSVTMTEDTNAFGISSVAVSGFLNNDFVKLGEEIRQQYDETPQQFYQRAYDILIICSELMDSVNGILCDEGSWSSDYFQTKLNGWIEKKRATL